jgi:hypothetical protein
MESVFGDVDRNKDGKVASEFPAWSQMTHVDNLREEINQIDVGIRSGRFATEEIYKAKMEKADKENKMDAIMKSKPKPNDSERNMLYKHYRAFGEKISAALYTRSDMALGLAPAHEEAKRMKLPCIVLTPDECAMAISCDVTPDKKRMVSRDHATKVFKLLGKILDEPANVEHLRLDKRVETHIPMEVAAPKPVAPQHLEGTSQEAAKPVKLNKDGTPDKRYQNKG